MTKNMLAFYAAGTVATFAFAMSAAAQSVGTPVVDYVAQPINAGVSATVSGGGDVSATNDYKCSGDSPCPPNEQHIAPAVEASGSSSTSGDATFFLQCPPPAGMMYACPAGAPSVKVSGEENAKIASTPLSITRSDLEPAPVPTAFTASGQVKTKADLSGFIVAQMQNDANVSAVQASTSAISVTYPQYAKLFGVFPVTVDTTATVNADGTVSISYPWYRFLLSSDDHDLQAKLQSRISTALQTSTPSTVNAGAAAQLSLAAQAKLISDMRATMQEELQANAGGSVSVK